MEAFILLIQLYCSDFQGEDRLFCEKHLQICVESVVKVENMTKVEAFHFCADDY